MYRLQITGRGIKATEPIKNYIEKKLSKVTKIFDKNIYIHCEIIKVNRKIGLPNNFELEITMQIPKAELRVEKQGENIYELIDEAEPVLKRMIKKHKDKLRKKKKKIKFSEAVNLM